MPWLKDCKRVPTLEIRPRNSKRKAAGGVHSRTLVPSCDTNSRKRHETQRTAYQEWTQLWTHYLSLSRIETNPEGDESTKCEKGVKEKTEDTDSRTKVITDSIKYTWPSVMSSGSKRHPPPWYLGLSEQSIIRSIGCPQLGQILPIASPDQSTGKRSPRSLTDQV